MGMPEVPADFKNLVVTLRPYEDMRIYHPNGDWIGSFCWYRNEKGGTGKILASFRFLPEYNLLRGTLVEEPGFELFPRSAEQVKLKEGDIVQVNTELPRMANGPKKGCYGVVSSPIVSDKCWVNFGFEFEIGNPPEKTTRLFFSVSELSFVAKGS